MPGSAPKTTKTAIHAAALELFVTRGFEETTMTDIADAVGLSRRSLYRYFEDKDEVFFDYHVSETELLEELLVDVTPDRLLPRLRDFARLLTADQELLTLRVEVLAKNPNLVGRALLRRSDWERRVAAALTRTTDASPDPTVEVNVLSAIAMGTLYVAVSEAMNNGRDFESTLDRALALIEPLFTPAGRAR